MLVFDIIYQSMIDPPSGWKYGFPKPLTQWHGQSLKDWLIQEGYPENDLDLALKYSRYWKNNYYMDGRLIKGEKNV